LRITVIPAKAGISLLFPEMVDVPTFKGREIPALAGMSERIALEMTP
jgi:hypothetical protein